MSLRDDALAGLANGRKTLPSKYFYDAQGSRLFEAICDLPEYYLTRTETALLAQIAPDIAAGIADGAALVEFGSGASRKTRLLLDAAPQLGLYVPIDVSPTALRQAVGAIAFDYPGLKIAPLIEDFTSVPALPAQADGLPRTGFFPGSTIGNFPPEEAVAFLRRTRHLLGEGAQLIIGADLAKDPDVLIPAYDDAQGVTAAFNRNLLTRLNREIDGDFDVDAFEHRAIWNARESRIEMHLVSRQSHRVSVAGQTIAFDAGESIHTENSYKYQPNFFARLVERGGWRVTASWTSDPPAFGIFVLTA
jgi:dimethylhistidine N-methyltransferase